MGHDKKVKRAYHRELALAFLVYAVLLVSAIRFGRPMAVGTLRTVILVTPMIGFGLAIWAIARHVKRIDEYQRQLFLETFAIASATTAALTFTYGFLETAGFPRISMFNVWVLLGTSWLVVCVIRYFLKR